MGVIRQQRSRFLDYLLPGHAATVLCWQIIEIAANATALRAHHKLTLSVEKARASHELIGHEQRLGANRNSLPTLSTETSSEVYYVPVHSKGFLGRINPNCLTGFGLGWVCENHPKRAGSYDLGCNVGQACRASASVLTSLRSLTSVKLSKPDQAAISVRNSDDICAGPVVVRPGSCRWSYRAPGRCPPVPAGVPRYVLRASTAWAIRMLMLSTIRQMIAA